MYFSVSILKVIYIHCLHTSNVDKIYMHYNHIKQTKQNTLFLNDKNIKPTLKINGRISYGRSMNEIQSHVPFKIPNILTFV